MVAKFSTFCKIKMKTFLSKMPSPPEELLCKFQQLRRLQQAKFQQAKVTLSQLSQNAA